MLLRPTILILVLGVAVASANRTSAAEPIAFNRDIRPLLADNCFGCHGPDSASRKAGLRLDRRVQQVDIP